LPCFPSSKESLPSFDLSCFFIFIFVHHDISILVTPFVPYVSKSQSTFSLFVLLCSCSCFVCCFVNRHSSYTHTHIQSCLYDGGMTIKMVDNAATNNVCLCVRYLSLNDVSHCLPPSSCSFLLPLSSRSI
jgi:hypothetical protein